MNLSTYNALAAHARAQSAAIATLARFIERQANRSGFALDDDEWRELRGTVEQIQIRTDVLCNEIDLSVPER